MNHFHNQTLTNENSHRATLFTKSVKHPETIGLSTTTTAAAAAVQRRPLSNVANVLPASKIPAPQMKKEAIGQLNTSTIMSQPSMLFRPPHSLAEPTPAIRIPPAAPVTTARIPEPDVPMDIEFHDLTADTADFNDDVVDIDEEDVGNELMATEYVVEIYERMYGREITFRPDPDYMTRQREVNGRMRGITVDWLVDVHNELSMNTDTIFLCVKLLDLYLSRVSIDRRRLQLAAVTCMLIASKVEEIYSPSVNDFVGYCDSAYTHAQILDMEREVLNTLEFNVTHPTPIYFLRRYVKAIDGDTELKHLACYFMELMTVDYNMLRHTPSKIAALALYLADKLTNGEARWDKTMEHYSRYSARELEAAVEPVRALVRNENTSTLRSVSRKYESPKFTRASLRARTKIVGA